MQQQAATQLPPIQATFMISLRAPRQHSVNKDSDIWQYCFENSNFYLYILLFTLLKRKPIFQFARRSNFVL